MILVELVAPTQLGRRGFEMVILSVGVRKLYIFIGIDIVSNFEGSACWALSLGREHFSLHSGVELP